MSAPQAVIIGKLASGDNEDAIFAMLETEANRYATLWSAINSSQTWGDFRSQCASDSWSELVTHFADCEVSIPTEDCQFDSAELPGLEDGDWPPSPQATIKGWLPEPAVHLLQPFETVHNGEFFEFNGRDKTSLIAILENVGFTCVEDTDLLQRACNYLDN